MEAESIITAAGIILVVSIAFSMVGLGGGVLYVPILLALGISIYGAAAISLFVIAVMSIPTVIINYRRGTIDWKLAFVLEPPTAVLAFIGGILASSINETILIIIFAGILFVTSIIMVIPIKDRQSNISPSRGYWSRKKKDESYVIHLRGLIPVSAIAGFLAGMIGVSGGALKLPAMVLIGRVPMRIAIGTSSFMVAITAIAGLSGHVIDGSFNILTALPLAIAAFIGGYIGSSLSSSIKVPILNVFIAVILFLISLWLIISTLV